MTISAAMYFDVTASTTYKTRHYKRAIKFVEKAIDDAFKEHAAPSDSHNNNKHMDVDTYINIRKGSFILFFHNFGTGKERLKNILSFVRKRIDEFEDIHHISTEVYYVEEMSRHH